jgi:hypothetical protein
MTGRYLVLAFQPADRRISLDAEWAESPTDAMKAVADVRQDADVLVAWAPDQMRRMADLLAAMSPRQSTFNRQSAELEELGFFTNRTILPVSGAEPPTQRFLVISYCPITEAVHLDTELSAAPDAALISVARIRVRAHVILAVTSAQLREMAANLDCLTLQQIALNRRAAEQEERDFYPKSRARQ